MAFQLTRKYGEPFEIRNRKTDELIARISVEKRSAGQYRVYLDFDGDEVRISKCKDLRKLYVDM